MKKSIIISIIVLVIIIAGYFIIFSNNSEDITEESSESIVVNSNQEQRTEQQEQSDESSSRISPIEIDLIAKQWEFSPQLIEVNLGDKVELHIQSEDVTHGIIIPEYGISERIKPGEDIHAEFTADKKGTFNFYCSVPCGRGHGGMNGIIVVK